MKCIVAGHVPVTATEYTELALGLSDPEAGIDLELFTGRTGESATDRAARLDVAREILAELHESDPQAAALAESLLRTSPVNRKPRTRRTRKTSARRVLRPAAGSVAVAA
ncbi:hypothetical protein [Streptomyces sp. SCSIO ZS0520]|uniref:hypothetical protein n=1 Tax=Streptomyces sp. SCSIO ZS0520 TaxID=2892996 RepID=UPI0021D817A4|nr:hypothetical protein [Streptomyces sp. SCSIO ZS0520]